MVTTKDTISMLLTRKLLVVKIAGCSKGKEAIITCSLPQY